MSFKMFNAYYSDALKLIRTPTWAQYAMGGGIYGISAGLVAGKPDVVGSGMNGAFYGLCAGGILSTLAILGEEHPIYLALVLLGIGRGVYERFGSSKRIKPGTSDASTSTDGDDCSSADCEAIMIEPEQDPISVIAYITP